jgi:hypothetical protein
MPTWNDLEAAGAVSIFHLLLVLLSGVYIPVSIYRWAVLYCCVAGSALTFGLLLFKDWIKIKSM